MRAYLTIVLIFISSLAKAQLPKDITFYYKNYSLLLSYDNKVRGPFIITAIPKTIKKPVYLSHARIIQDSLERKRLYTISKDSFFIKEKYYRDPIISYDTSFVHCFVQGVNSTNAAGYEYRAIDNDKNIIVPWTTPDSFLNDSYISGYGENDPNMAYVGSFKRSWDTSLKIEVRKKKDTTHLICSGLIFWFSEKPEVAATYNGNQLNEFFKFFDFSSRNEAALDLQTEGIEFKTLTKQKSFLTNQNGIIFLLKDLVYKRIIEYRIIGDENNKNWKLNEFDFHFIWLKTLNPGKYKLQLRYSMQQENISEYEFEILPAWYQTSTFKIITGSLIAAILGLILLLFRQRSQKNKLNRQLEQKEKKELELRSIRSQLNPHFVFNALNSIQGLVNANEKEKANQYLSDFSNMMRDTLSGNSKDYSPLETELAILDRYLKLEQLRFGFTYEIKVKNSINTTAIEIPTLLLQPLVENAVKHGVAQLLDKGKITIELNRSENNLRVLINDNGQGFSESIDNKEGFGIRLTRERIQLINQLNKSNTISLKFKKHSDAMLAEIIFSGTF